MGSQKTVLLADDESQFRENVAEVLQANGIAVFSACDGLEALLALREHRPDMAVLGILLPKIDGGRVCRLIRQDRDLRQMPVIALSPLSLEDTKRFPELSADAYVAKRAWKEAGQDILAAIEYLQNSGQLGLTNGIFGYSRFRPLKLSNEVLLPRRHYEMLLRGLSFGVLELDPKGRILMANTRAADLLHAREANLIGNLLQERLPESDREAVAEAIRIAAKSAAPKEQQIPLAIPSVSLVLHSNTHGGQCLGFLGTMQ